MDQIRGNDAYCQEVAIQVGIVFKYRPLFGNQVLIDKLLDTLIS